MKKSKRYDHTRFTAEVIKQARAVFDAQVGLRRKESPRLSLSVEVDGAAWGHDSEDEFFADYRRTDGDAVYARRFNDGFLSVHSMLGHTTIVEIEASQTSKIEQVFEIFEQHLSECRLREPTGSLSTTGVTYLTDFLKKTKRYSRVRFAADVIKEASAVFDTETAAHKEAAPRLRLDAEVDGAEWRYDSEEEFFSGYRRRGAVR